MELEDNPYAAPPSSIAAQPPEIVFLEAPGEVVLAREVFLAWERLRLVYNGLLALESLVLGLPLLGDVRFWFFLGTGAVGANVCFCAGPCAEGYLELAGMNRRTARRVVFGLGLLLSVALTLAAVGSHLLPGMD